MVTAAAKDAKHWCVDSSGWASVRCVFRSDHDGNSVYEERVTLWRSDNLDKAIVLAEAEAETYAATLTGPPGWPTEYIGLAQAYLLVDEPGHGAEVFSLNRSSALLPDDYLNTFFDTGTEHERHTS
jgi:hypothetical protein